MLLKAELVCLALLSSVWKFSSSQFSDAGAWEFGNAIALCFAQRFARGASAEVKIARNTSVRSNGSEGADSI
jgi:hypothetical protein